MENKRNNRKRTIVAVLLLCGLMAGILAGCGGSGDKDGGKGSSGDRVTLTVGLPQASKVENYDTNAFTLYLEESLDIDLEFVYFPSNTTEMMQKLALMVSGNRTLPDVLVGFHGMGYYVGNEYGEDGYFMDLTELLEEYGDNFWEHYNQLSTEEQNLIMAKGTNPNDGCFYSMPIYKEMAIDNLQNLLFINQDWLDAVNMDAPTNLEELKAVLTAFRDKDPNGNGEKDEIPMLASADYVSTYIINAFVYYDTSNVLNVTDGKVWDPVSTDEYRQALITLREMVDEGLISNLSYTLGKTDMISKITPVDNEAEVGIFIGHPLLWCSDTSTILDQYVAFSALSGETDLGGYTVVRPQTLSWSGYITTDCENPEVAMKFLDFLYKDETVTSHRHGEKDVDWEYSTGVNDYGVEGAEILVLDDSKWTSGNSTWMIEVPCIRTWENYLAIKQEGEGIIAERSRMMGELWQVLENGKKPAETATELVYTSEEYQERDELKSLYNSYVSEARTLFIMGEQDPSNDKEWDSYLNTLKVMGQERLLEIGQAAYTRTQETISE